VSALRLTGLTKTYAGADRPALSNFNLDVKPGEFLVLVGPSGCGKSTALRSIAGLEEPDSGSIWIGEREVTHLPPRDRDIAMVFQNYALYPHMTVYDNLAFGLKLRKTPKEEINQRVREAAETLGLTRYLASKPKALSGGERQRVALGRALVRRPSVFLFDEPLSNLDAQLRVQIRAELHRLHQQLTATMIYVTHDQLEAMTLGDRIAVLSAGVLQQVDAPLEVYERPANRFVAGFLGSPSMNFLDAKVGEGGRTVRIAGANWTLDPALAAALSGRAGEAVTVGVRPEHLAVRPATGAGDDGALPGKVEFGEALGAETLLYIGTDAGRLVARLSGDARRSPGEAVRLVPEPGALRVFDASGIAVSAAHTVSVP
jgi:multiple sugar transport system ATP-binding protein